MLGDCPHRGHYRTLIEDDIRKRNPGMTKDQIEKIATIILNLTPCECEVCSQKVQKPLLQ